MRPQGDQGALWTCRRYFEGLRSIEIAFQCISMGYMEFQGIPGGFRWVQKMSGGLQLSFKAFPGGSESFVKLQRISGNSMGLQKSFNRSFRALENVEGSRGLPGISDDFKGVYLRSRVALRGFREVYECYGNTGNDDHYCEIQNPAYRYDRLRNNDLSEMIERVYRVLR